MVRRWTAALARVAVVGAAVLTGCDSVLVECVRAGHPVAWCELVVEDLDGASNGARGGAVSHVRD